MSAFAVGPLTANPEFTGGPSDVVLAAHPDADCLECRIRIAIDAACARLVFPVPH